MTARLTEALRRLADEAPPASVPEGLFDTARARHRRRRAAVAGALAVLVLLLGTGYVLHPVALLAPAAPRLDGPGLPSRLVDPPWRTAAVAQSAPGPAAALFGGPAVRSDWDEARMGVVAAEADRYRVLDVAPVTPGFDALLSPDGRHVWAGGVLVDLTSGRSTSDGVAGRPLAFAPDGTRLAYADDQDTFTPPNTYGTPFVGLYDPASRADVLRMRVGVAWVAPAAAAIAPDGGELAVQVRDEVWVARVADADRNRVAEPYRRLPLAGGRLAGPGSWAPDGRSLTTVERSSCTDCPVPGYPRTWRLVTRQVADGAPVGGAAFPELRSATYVQVVGWRSADEAVALVGRPGPGAVDRPDTYDISVNPHREPGTAGVELVRLRRGASAPEVLLRTPAGITELSVAADLAVAGQVRASGDPEYGPPPFWLLAVGIVLAVLVALPLLALVRRLRGRRGGPASGRRIRDDSPAPDGP
ncbi:MULTISPECIES: hypothetical protein [unclassified Micromonospora]|uniref:hypothetical protein n=1 Tax=unclassified Micromonospora TaxID=2617518 RepID=UPI002FF3D0E1